MIRLAAHPLPFALALALLLAASAVAKPRIGRIFGDHMVLQRERPVPVWGWADAGDTITVEFAGQTQTAVADAGGAWRVTLDPMPASAEPRPLIVRAPATEWVAEFKDVLVGEVWLCGGQSNMGLALRDCFRAPEEIAAADHPHLRYFAVPAVGAPVPAADLAGGKWQVCSPATAGNFAGTAFFFGQALLLDLQVPVGLVEFDRGATGIEGWVSLAGYEASAAPALQTMYREAASWNPAHPLGRQAHETAFARIADWVPQAKAALAAGQPVPPQPLLPAPSRQIPGPSTTFNGTIHPLIPLAVRGAAWYQGEANPGEGEIYEQKLRAMIAGWRIGWAQPDLPVCVVQLANEGNTVLQPMDEEHFRYVPVREAQRRAATMPNTGLVVTIDLGEDASGHPRNKRDVGARIAQWALATQYGRQVPASGPLYRRCHRTGDAMTIEFDHAESGLMVADKAGLDPVVEIPDGAMKQFAIAGADGVWHWAEARIDGQTVVVRSAAVPEPVAVRYAYSMNPKGPKLYSRDGLPASPFRTDPWQP